MILRFPNHEQASLCVAELRSEGHFAEICNDISASLWGPAAVGGVRVIATDEPVAEDCEPPSEPHAAGGIKVLMRVVVLVLWFTAAGWIGLNLLMAALGEPLGFIVVLLLLAAAVCAIAGMSLLWHRMLSGSMIRSAEKSVSDTSSSLVFAIAVLASVGVLVVVY